MATRHSHHIHQHHIHILQLLHNECTFVRVCVYCLLSAIMALACELLFILFVLVFIVLKHLPEDGGSKTADWLLRLKVTLIGYQ